VEEAFAKGFAEEMLKISAVDILKLSAATPVPWHRRAGAAVKQIPGYGAGRFAMRMAPLAALAAIPPAIAAYGLGKGLRTPATTEQPWEERF